MCEMSVLGEVSPLTAHPTSICSQEKHNLTADRICEAPKAEVSQAELGKN